MAEVERAPQQVASAGAEPTVIAGMSAADTQIIPNKNGNVFLRVINGAAEATKVTIVIPGFIDGVELPDKEVEVAATKTKLIGPFQPSIYNNAAGNIEVKFSKVTTVTLEVTKVGQ